MSVVNSYLYEDGCEPCGNDTFSREPFVVKFVAPHTGKDSPQLPPQQLSLPPPAIGALCCITKHSLFVAEVKELVLVPLHTTPRDAVTEIDALYDVYLDVISKWGIHVRGSGGQQRLSHQAVWEGFWSDPVLLVFFSAAFCSLSHMAVPGNGHQHAQDSIPTSARQAPECWGTG